MPFANRFEVLIGGKKIAAPPLTSRDSTIGNLPAVPVSAETLLRMELLARESATDLGAFSDAVLADAGATIQILRLAGQEYGTAADRPERIEDCISELGPQACLNAAAKGALFGSMPSRANSAFWVHAREAAQYFKMFAVLDGLGITPDQAYLTGLLHALGALPAVLGWERFGLHGDPARLALAIAEQWQLPRFVIDFFSEVFLPGSCPAWAKFITVAHHPAKESWLEVRSSARKVFRSETPLAHGDIQITRSSAASFFLFEVGLCCRFRPLADEDAIGSRTPVCARSPAFSSFPHAIALLKAFFRLFQAKIA